MSDTPVQDWHKKASNPHAGTIRFLGSLAGNEYDVAVNVLERSAVWVDGTLEQKAEEDNSGFLSRALDFARQAPRGALGLTKVGLGIGIAPEKIVNERREICLACSCYNGFGMCSECGCCLDAKIRLKNQKCPKSKWLKVTVSAASCSPCEG